MGRHEAFRELKRVGNPVLLRQDAGDAERVGGVARVGREGGAWISQTEVDKPVFDVEDLAMGFIRFDNGAVLQIEFSWASNIEHERRFVELMGTKAGFAIDGAQMKIFAEENGQLLDIVPPGTQRDDGHARNLRNFVDVLLDGAEPCYKPQQGVDMIAILEGFYKSAAEGREVRLDG